MAATGPRRNLDTRPNTRLHHAGGLPAAGEVVQAPVGEGGAAIINVTATQAVAAGFVTAYPSDLSRPNASNLNLDHAGQTIPNLVIVPAGPDGLVRLYTQAGTHLVVDQLGVIPS